MAREMAGKKRAREETAASVCSLKARMGESAGLANIEAAKIDDSQERKVELSSDVQSILAALQEVRQKTISDGRKKGEELLASTSSTIKGMMDDAKKKAEKERQNLSNGASKICKEYEIALKDEADKFKNAYETFSTAKDLHLQAYEDIFAKFAAAQEKVLNKCEQQRKKEKSVICELQTICFEKMAETELLVKQKMQEEKSLHILKTSLGSIFDSDGSDADLYD